MRYSIGERIKNKREACGLTQKQLARLIDVNEAVVSNWETGKNRPNTDVLKKLCDALSCTADCLLDLSVSVPSFTSDAQKVAKAYETAEEKTKKIVRCVLGLD